MSRTKRTVNPLGHLLLALLLAGGGMAALAQEQSGEKATEQSGTTEVKAVKKPSTAKKKPDPIDESSPFDYQASEEISQDLSVSFPVDI